TAQVGMVVYWCLRRPHAPREEVPHAEREACAAPLPRLLCWVGGLTLGVVLLIPQFGYFGDVWRFTQDHPDYLFALSPAEIGTFLLINSPFLAALVVVSVAGYVARYIPTAGSQPVAAGEEGAAAGADGQAPPPAGPSAAVTTSPNAAAPPP